MAGSEDRLQQYFDGELEGARAESVRAELERNPELRAKLEGLAHLRRLLVDAAEQRGDEVDSDALFARITAKLATAEDVEDDDPMLPPDEATPVHVMRPALKLVANGRTAEAAKPAAATKPATSNGPAKKRNVIWIGVGTALAIAAAVLLIVLDPFGAGRSPEMPVAAAPPPGTEVIEVDFGYSTGAVFSVRGQEGERYAVVWISDENPAVGRSDERVQ
jgi:hypothetical protein